MNAHWRIHKRVFLNGWGGATSGGGRGRPGCREGAAESGRRGRWSVGEAQLVQLPFDVIVVVIMVVEVRHAGHYLPPTTPPRPMVAWGGGSPPARARGTSPSSCFSLLPPAPLSTSSAQPRWHRCAAPETQTDDAQGQFSKGGAARKQKVSLSIGRRHITLPAKTSIPFPWPLT